MKALEIDETTTRNAIQPVMGGLSSALDRVLIALLVLTLLVAIWWFSQAHFPGTVTESSYFIECPAISAHC